MASKLFRFKDSGVVASLPEHYANHPVFGKQIEPYEPELVEYEEEKVVTETHELPVDQRIINTAHPAGDADDDKELESGWN